MQIHQLQPNHHRKRARRIGRGGKRGSYSGRGIKGMGARAGAKRRPALRDIIKRIPKLRGYKFRSFQKTPMVAVDMRHIEKKLKAGEIVNPAVLLKYRIIRKVKGRVPRVKILGQGAIKKKFVFENLLFSGGKKPIQNVQLPKKPPQRKKRNPPAQK